MKLCLITRKCKCLAQVQIQVQLVNDQKPSEKQLECSNCFQCSRLYVVGYHFICRDERYTFCAVEPPLTGCKFNDLKRSKITGQAERLLRFMSMTHNVLVKSIPSRMVGAMGILMKYKLITVKDGMIRKGDKLAPGNFVREKFAYMKQGIGD